MLISESSPFQIRTDADGGECSLRVASKEIRQDSSSRSDANLQGLGTETVAVAPGATLPLTVHFETTRPPGLGTQSGQVGSEDFAFDALWVVQTSDPRRDSVEIRLVLGN